MRVTSLIPAGTEIAFVVGAGDDVVGVSHACDYPPEAGERTVVTRPRFEPGELTSRQIYDQKVEVTATFGSLFRLDESKLWGLRSNVLIIPGPGDHPLIAFDSVRATAEGLNPRPALLILNPQHLDDVLDDIARVGFEVGRFQEARALVDELRQRIETVEEKATGVKPQNVAFVQWIEPGTSGGYWIPQLIELAGGRDVLNIPGVSPSPFEWSDVSRERPDVIVIACEGMSVERVLEERGMFSERPSWSLIKAVRQGRVFVGDGGYFTRGSPRLIEGLEALAWAIHPDRFEPPAPQVLQKFED